MAFKLLSFFLFLGASVTTSAAAEWQDYLQQEDSSSAQNLGQQGSDTSINLPGKPVSFSTDSMLYHYATNGYNSCIDEWKYYYMMVMPTLNHDNKLEIELQTQKIAEQYKSKPLMCELEFMKAMHLLQTNEAEIATKIEAFQSIAEKAHKRNDIDMKLRAMAEIFYIHMFSTPYNYAKGFMQASRLAEELENVTEEQCIEKRTIYYRIGEAYYFFHDYDKARLYLTKALSDSPNYSYDWADVWARNILGDYYSSVNKIDTSDYYFRSMIESGKKVKSTSYWQLLATISMADNLTKRKQYDKAIDMYRECLAYIPTVIVYANSAVIGLAECYMQKGDLPSAKSLLDKSHEYSTQLLLQGDTSYTQLYKYYTLSSVFYIKKHDERQALSYLDSAITVNHKEDERFNGMNILRAEQEILEMQVDAKNQQIHRQQRQMRIMITFFSIIAILLGVVFVFYRKTRKAYRSLVLKSEEWAKSSIIQPSVDISNTSESRANDETATDNQEIDEQADAENKHLFDTLQQLMVKEKLFLNPETTLDSLAGHLNIPRNTLSQAINRCAGKNFNTYINAYRVKEVINTLQKPENKNITMDELSELAGFKSRSTFYDAFKNITGLTPTQFKRNKGSLFFTL